MSQVIRFNSHRKNKPFTQVFCRLGIECWYRRNGHVYFPTCIIRPHGTYSTETKISRQYLSKEDAIAAALNEGVRLNLLEYKGLQKVYTKL
jgi:hypothetical protein